MGRRRQFGAIRQLPSGRYQARLPDGSVAPTTFLTKADANRWLSAAETDLIRGTFVDERTVTTLTVGEWLTEWHAEHSLHKRPGTLARDRSAIRTHLEPALGDVALANLRPQDVQRFVARLTDVVGPGTTHSVYAVLRSALRAAADLDLITRAPTRGVKLPPIPKTDVGVLRPEDLELLASAIYGIVIKLYRRDHPPPHFHAEYSGDEALIVISDGSVYAGWLPRRAVRLVRTWRALHVDELRRAWDLAVAHEDPGTIDPLP